MMGEIVRREADMAIAPLVATSKREKSVDFSTPFFDISLSLITLKNENDVRD
jgi:hypothetical protein